MDYNIESDPDFSVIKLPVTTGQLTLVLTKSAFVSDEKLYEEIKKQKNMEVKHVFCAAGKMDIHYPPGISVHMCSMYDANHEKIKALCMFRRETPYPQRSMTAVDTTMNQIVRTSMRLSDHYVMYTDIRDYFLPLKVLQEYAAAHELDNFGSQHGMEVKVDRRRSRSRNRRAG